MRRRKLGFENLEYRRLLATASGQLANDPPVAQGDQYDLFAGSSLMISPVEGVLTNDSDIDGDALEAVLVSGPLDGALTLNDDGSFTYQPNVLYFGTDSFTYQAFDGQAYSDVVEVTLRVDLPTTNPLYPGDVNADGYLSALDPLLIANHIAVNGIGPLPDDFVAPPFLDYNADGLVNQEDVDGTVTHVDQTKPGLLPKPRLEISPAAPVPGPGEMMSVRLETTDLSGIPISQIDAGQPFYLSAWVADRRLEPQGVFAAYVDVFYDASKVAIDGVLTHGPEFSKYAVGKTTLSGLIDETGSGRDAELLDGGEHLLWRVPMRAESGGGAMFSVNSADLTVEHPMLLFGWDGPIPNDNISFADTELVISGPPQAENDVYFAVEDKTLVVDELDGVLANDTDDEDDALTAQLVDAPSHGDVQLNLNGSFIYMPDADYFGSDQFTYRANDGLLDSGVATVLIHVLAADSDEDGVGDRVEDAAPNGGDFNADGIPDRLQGHVASLPTFDGSHYVRFESEVQTPFRRMRAVDNPSPADSPQDVHFEHGFFRYEMIGLAGGASTTAVFRADGSAAATLVYSYGPTPDQTMPHWYRFMRTNTSGAMVFSDGTDILYADGERGDHDLAADGTITSTVGIGSSALPWKNPNLPEDVNNSGDVTPVDALILINLINQRGPQALPPVPTPGLAIPPYLDPSGDDALTAADVLQVIARLNADAVAAATPEGESWDRSPESLAEPASAPRTLEPNASTVFVLPRTNHNVTGRQIVSPPSSARPTEELVQTGASSRNTEHWGTEPVLAFSTELPTTKAERIPVAESSLTDDELEDALEDIATAVARVWTLW